MKKEILELIKEVLIPFVLISAEGLVALTVQNRFGRVIDRVREINSKIEGDPQREKPFIEELKILFKRGLLLRNSMICLFISIMLCILSSLMIFTRKLIGISIYSFSAALLFFFAGMAIAIIDLFVSYDALRTRVNLTFQKFSRRLN